MNDGPDGDLILKPFMQNRLMFATPTDDPLYSSHKNISSWDLGQEVTNYASDDPAKGVACTQHVSRNTQSCTRTNTDMPKVSILSR
jgi:hypothetical protein